MRPLISKYANDCRKCGTSLPVGSEVIYEKRVGIFCPPCAPTDPEEIRTYRQQAADRRAEKYEDWAEKRRDKAAALEARNAPYRGDIAFNTQPGHIPERARVIARTDKAWEHSRTAARFEGKAAGLRSGVRVKGDAKQRHDARDEAVRATLQPGMMADWMGRAFKVLKVNRKTAMIDARFGAPFRVPLHLLTPINERTP